VNNLLGAILPMLMLQLSLPAFIRAQDKPASPSGLRILSSDSSTGSNIVVISAHNAVRPHAVAVSALGKCDCAEDGLTFSNLECGRGLQQGAVIRTGDGGRADFYFWRTGATLRLEAGTEVKLEQMVIHVRGGRPVMDIALELRAGKILAVVRPAKTDSTLEIRNAAGRTVVQGSRVGRYIITADGIDVSVKDSAAPLSLISASGTLSIAAGEQFTKQKGKTLFVPSALFVQDLAQLDELQAAAQQPLAKESSANP
jgi:hypothetical protein